MFFHKGDITNAIIGGAIMALASSLHLLVKGKITGISGSCFRVVKGDSFYYNLSFLLGMVFVSSTAKVFYGGSFVFENTSSYIIDLSFLGFVPAVYKLNLIECFPNLGEKVIESSSTVGT